VGSPIPLFLSLGADQSIALGEEIAITASTNVSLSELDTIVWQSEDGVLFCDICLTQNVQPLNTNDYQVLIIDENGCLREDTVRINVEKKRAVYLPNAFSPDGNGTNDRFTIFAGDSVLKIRSLRIYNRWGEAVFNAFDFLPNEERFGWDGFFNGAVVNPGVFVYWTEVVFIDGEVILFKGEVTVVK